MMPSVLVMTASGSIMTMLATLTRTSAALMSRIGSVKKWGMRRRRGTGSTPSEVIGGLFSFNSFFSSHFLIYRSFHQRSAITRRPRPYSSSKDLHVVFYAINAVAERSSPNDRRRTVLPLQRTPNTPIRTGFFELPEALAAQGPRRFFFRASRIERAREHRSSKQKRGASRSLMIFINNVRILLGNYHC
jgi:hypothetical protein